jgi:dTDP-4-amino-4,6-dideoxygalactose transaminase
MSADTKFRIPFNKPPLVGDELAYIQQAIERGHLSGDGDFTKACHQFLEKELSVPKALLTTSCTHALEMSALLLELKPGDEVIIPSFTFVSTVNAFVLRGAIPVFIDIRSDTLNLDETRLEELITDKTRAIVVVHYAGVGCEMDTILDIAARYNVPVVEDNAHGLFSKYNDRYLGTFGSFATQSFHETKNFTCGEGGALLINDPQYITRAEYIREKGTNRSRFFRGQVDKYTWIDIGSSYLPSEILAGYLLAQFEKRETIQDRRREIWERYHTRLEKLAHDHDVVLPIVPSHCKQSHHMYYILLPAVEVRQALISYLRSHGILAVFHYLPLHLSKMGEQFGGKPGDCPVTESISDRLLRLPFYFDLTQSQQEQVIQSVYQFFDKHT